MRVAVKIAYDGQPFYGYARQPELRTVEGDIINSLKASSIINDIKKAMFLSASRTDKGVSSFGNVFSFKTDATTEHLLSLLAENLTDIIPYAIKTVDDSFYPRHAKTRWYRYYLPNENLSIDELKSICEIFQGTHDFSNFARIEPHKNPIRTIDRIHITKEHDFFCIDFFAQTFLWHQIRRIISATSKAIEQKITQDDIKMALTHPEKQYDFGVAPSEFLVLMDVNYPDIIFQVDPGLLKRKEECESRLIKRFRGLSF